ncbi:MAG: PAS domain S-box protein [Candidatus Lokiarchaeota archaeon]|nr:PAS domain S-box protein [Candidatus Lokiarchaeota archaeon]
MSEKHNSELINIDPLESSDEEISEEEEIVLPSAIDIQVDSLDTSRKQFFNQILGMIQSLSEQKDIISKILDEGCSILNASSAALVIWEDKLGFFNSISGFPEEMNIRGHLINTNEGLSGRIYSEQKTIWIRNYSKSIYCYKLFKKLNFNYAIGTPIVIRGELIGNVNFYYKSMPEADNELLKRFIEDLSQQLSIVIINSRIYQELQENAKKLENVIKYRDVILDHSPNIIIDLDNNGKIQYWNKTATDILGYSPHEMADCNLPLADHANSEQFLKYFIDARKGIEYEKAPIDFKRSNNDVVTLNLKIVPLITSTQRKKGEEAKSILIFAMDVSRKHILEQKIKQTELELHEQKQELEKTQEKLKGISRDLKNKEKLARIGRIYGNLANQINNPLMIISNWVQVLMDSHEDAPSPKSQETYAYLMEIPSEIERIAEIVRNLRVYSEIATQKIEDRDSKVSHGVGEDTIPRSNDVTVINPLYDAVKDIKRCIKGERIKIDVVSNFKKNPPVIKGRYRHLKTCFYHILENAVISLRFKDLYTKLGLIEKKWDRKIKVTIGEKIINGIPYVRIEIHDSGIGIDRDEIRNIKKAFHSNWPSIDDIQELAESVGKKLNAKDLEIIRDFCEEGFKQKLKDKKYCVGMGLTIASLIVKSHEDSSIHAKLTPQDGVSFIMDFKQVS